MLRQTAVRRLFALMATLGVAAAATARSTTDKGFRDLFNGRDITGFKVVGEGTWTAKDGELVAPGKGSTWLRTEETFTDFELKLEFLILAGANSGVFFHAPAEGRSSRLGFEVQILDDAGKPANKTSTGSLYDVLAPSANASKPPGEWNKLDIRVKGPHIVVVLNGKKVIDMRCDDTVLEAGLDDDHKIAKRHKSGYIGFQDHGSAIRFRNVRIKTP